MASYDLDILQGSLEKLIDDDAQIQGAAIVSPDGLILVSTLKDRDKNDRLAAMTSEMLTAGNMTTSEMELGSLFLSMVFGTEGGVAVRGIDHEMVLCTIFSRSANVGNVVQHINRTVKRISATV